MQKKIIYLDHAATTPLDSKVFAAMKPYFINEFGNPSSIYEIGEKTRLAIENSRKQISSFLNCRSSEIFFTAGGTESINMALFGVVNEKLKKQKKLHVITSAIEHDAVLKTCKALESKGVKLTYLPVDANGFVNPIDLAKAFRPETVLVSIMYANNEIGTIQPINQIASVIRKENKKRKQDIIFHIDACQAAGVLSLNVNKLGVDLMTLNASKIYGPKQVGLLYIRTGIKIEPLIYGGGQERGLRSGTENTAGIVGFAKALEIAEKLRERESKRLVTLRDYFLSKLKKHFPKIIVNGGEDNRLPNNINVSFPNIEGETLLIYLDNEGIVVSIGSACSSTSLDASYVLLALGRNEKQARASIRFTMGRSTNKADLDKVLKVLVTLVKQISGFKKLVK